MPLRHGSSNASKTLQQHIQQNTHLLSEEERERDEREREDLERDDRDRERERDRERLSGDGERSALPFSACAGGCGRLQC